MIPLPVHLVALACVGALAFASAGAAASPAAPSFPEPRTERDRQEADQALQEARGALARQEWAQAELLLERALMLRPESAEAMIELARLLAQRGRLAEALALLRALAQDPRTPAAQAQTLTALLERLDPSAGAGMRPGEPAQAAAPVSSLSLLGPPLASHTGQPHTGAIDRPSPNAILWRLEALAGHSSNPLVVTSASNITLTLPDGAFQLPLEGRPQSAAYGGITWAARARNGVEAVLQAQQIDLPGQRSAYRAAIFQPIAALGPRGGSGASSPILLAGLLRSQRFGDGSHRHQLDLQATHRGPWTLNLGWYEEPDRQRHGPLARLEWGAPINGWLQSAAWAEAEGNRDAGAPGHAGFGGRLIFTPHPAWTLHLQGQAQRDTAGYSKLLENNARRLMRTQHLSIEHAIGGKPLGPWRIRVYDARRISNLALFSSRDTGMQLIWRKAW